MKKREKRNEEGYMSRSGNRRKKNQGGIQTNVNVVLKIFPFYFVLDKWSLRFDGKVNVYMMGVSRNMRLYNGFDKYFGEEATSTKIKTTFIVSTANTARKFSGVNTSTLSRNENEGWLYIICK